MDVWRLEDAQFDMLIGKEPADPLYKELNQSKPLNEIDVLHKMNVPFKPKQETLSEQFNHMMIHDMHHQKELNFVVSEYRFMPGQTP